MAHELWVFAYGSLIWDPGFDVAESRVGLAPQFLHVVDPFSRNPAIAGPGVGA